MDTRPHFCLDHILEHLADPSQFEDNTSTWVLPTGRNSSFKREQRGKRCFISTNVLCLFQGAKGKENSGDSDGGRHCSAESGPRRSLHFERPSEWPWSTLAKWHCSVGGVQKAPSLSKFPLFIGGKWKIVQGVFFTGPALKLLSIWSHPRKENDWFCPTHWKRLSL